MNSIIKSILFITIIVLAFIFRDILGYVYFPILFLMLMIIFIFYIAGSGWVDKAKLRSPKFISYGINSTTLPYHNLVVGEYTFFSLGGWNDTILGEHIGREGIVQIYTPLLRTIDNNVITLGDLNIIPNLEISNKTKKLLQHKFGYVPKNIYYLKPKTKYQTLIKEIDSSNESKITEYFEDLEQQKNMLIRENEFLRNTIESLGSAVDTAVDSSMSTVKNVLSEFKKERKDFNKPEK